MVELQQQQQTNPEEAEPLTQREICSEVLGKKSGYFFEDLASNHAQLQPVVLILLRLTDCMVLYLHKKVD